MFGISSTLGQDVDLAVFLVIMPRSGDPALRLGLGAC